MTENFLKNKIEELKLEIELKNKDISNFQSRIEYLEEMIIEIEKSLSKKSNKNSNLLLKFQKHVLKKKYRALKNKMGFLRKENINLKKELENKKDTAHNSSSIKIITQNSLSNQVKTALAKDLVYIEKEIKKKNMNKEEITNKLRHFMKIIMNK